MGGNDLNQPRSSASCKRTRIVFTWKLALDHWKSKQCLETMRIYLVTQTVNGNDLGVKIQTFTITRLFCNKIMASLRPPGCQFAKHLYPGWE